MKKKDISHPLYDIIQSYAKQEWIQDLSNHWLGYQDSNLGCRYQKPVPYRLAIPQRWCWLRESNPRPTDYKSVALPAELNQPTRIFYHDITFTSSRFSYFLLLFSLSCFLPASQYFDRCLMAYRYFGYMKRH